MNIEIAMSHFLASHHGVLIKNHLFVFLYFFLFFFLSFLWHCLLHHKVVLTFKSWLWMKSYSVNIQIKTTEQYFPVVLFIVLYKVVLTFESVDEILKCDHSNESN